MIEQKLVVGRFITMPPVKNRTIIENLGFKTQGRIRLTIEQSSGFFTKSSKVVAGAVGKEHRHFQWLFWIPGFINQVPFENLDVLTGPMSGCWITKYRIGATEYIGHIGTNYQMPAQTIAAKAAWMAFARANPTAIIGGYQPRWTGIQPSRIKGESESDQRTYSLVTTGGYYTVLLYRQPTITTTYRVAGIQKVNPADTVTLQTLFTP